MNDRRIRKVLVVGGGTGGWITAGLLARKLSKGADPVTVQLIESSDVPVIGVGEGTFPSMLHTLQYLGVDEQDFIRRCSATFKQGIKFSSWADNPDLSEGFYYHLFDTPVNSGGFDLTYYWLSGRERSQSFSHSVAAQSFACDRSLAPRPLSAAPYTFSQKYAYHLDSGKFIEFLRDHCVRTLGVEHTIATIETVARDDTGFIADVISDDGRVFSGDFFIDCSGFKSILLGRSLGAKFIDVGQYLLADRALAVQQRYETPNSEIASCTHAKAQRSGWIWDIGLQSRRGVGYVYSGNHSSESEALLTLADYLGKSPDGLEARSIPMKVGYREEFWRKNCVAIGLSSGFVEPLEATAIAMIEQSAKMLAERFPTRFSDMKPLAQKYNRVFRFRWEKIVDFIKFHYCISRRDDSDFWIDNRSWDTIPARLQEQLDVWERYPMGEIDFSDKYEMFNLASYRYVAYGMGYNLGLPDHLNKYSSSAQMQKLYYQYMTKRLPVVERLPSHRALIDHIIV